MFILQNATNLLTRDPNMVEVKSPVTSKCLLKFSKLGPDIQLVCGDIHGQYVCMALEHHHIKSNNCAYEV